MTTPLNSVLPKVVTNQTSKFHGVFTIEPLEQGFGTTIGNAMRRTILSSIEGYAITHFSASRPIHEFDTIEGVVEDVTEIILNLKQVRLKKNLQGTAGEDKLTVHIKPGTQVFTAGDLMEEGETTFEIINPDQVICHTDESLDIEFTFIVKKGKGYVPAEEHKAEQEHEQELGTIAIDAIYTPIKNVKIHVENTLVGRRADYEKLVMEIETDGSITTEEVLKSAGSMLIRYFQIFAGDNIVQAQEEVEPVNEEALYIKRLKQTPLQELGLSVRSYNSLKANNIKTLGDIMGMQIKDLMKLRNFGKTSLKELQEIFAAKGLVFGAKQTPPTPPAA